MAAAIDRFYWQQKNEETLGCTTVVCPHGWAVLLIIISLYSRYSHSGHKVRRIVKFRGIEDNMGIISFLYS